MGSAYEVEYHALLSKDLGFIKADAYERLEGQIVEVKRMLAALLQKVRAERQTI
jgi:four helix bundle protein